MTISAIFKSCLVRFSVASTNKNTTSILSIRFMTSYVSLISSLLSILFFLLSPGVSKKVNFLSNILTSFLKISLVKPDSGPVGERYLLFKVL